jgi:hypothetical protein
LRERAENYAGGTTQREPTCLLRSPIRPAPFAAVRRRGEVHSDWGYRRDGRLYAFSTGSACHSSPQPPSRRVRIACSFRQLWSVVGGSRRPKIGSHSGGRGFDSPRLHSRFTNLTLSTGATTTVVASTLRPVASERRAIAREETQPRVRYGTAGARRTSSPWREEHRKLPAPISSVSDVMVGNQYADPLRAGRY